MGPLEPLHVSDTGGAEADDFGERPKCGTTYRELPVENLGVNLVKNEQGVGAHRDGLLTSVSSECHSDSTGKSLKPRTLIAPLSLVVE